MTSAKSARKLLPVFLRKISNFWLLFISITTNSFSCCDHQVPAGGEQAAVAVLLGHGRGGELDQGDGEHSPSGI